MWQDHPWLCSGWLRWHLSPSARVPATQGRALALLPGYGQAWANGVNRSGVVVGQQAPGRWSPEALPWLPVIWGASASVRALPLPAGMTDGAARAVNDKGVVVGSGTSPSHQSALAWTGRHVAVLPLPRGGEAAAAASVNDRGQAVGSATVVSATGESATGESATVAVSWALPARWRGVVP